MVERLAYLDTSALVKLVVSEPESPSLLRSLAQWPNRVSATLVRTEATRALRRSGNAHLLGSLRRILHALHLVRLDEPLLERAGHLEPVDLRSLDSIHLAAASALGPELGIMFVYDARLRDAAAALGIEVASPA